MAGKSKLHNFKGKKAGHFKKGGGRHAPCHCHGYNHPARKGR